MPKFSLAPGDRFVRLEGEESQWRVERIIQTPGVPDHVRLVNDTGKRRYLTYAVSVLGDKTRFRRIEGKAEERPAARTEDRALETGGGLTRITESLSQKNYALPPAASWRKQTA
jgi:hypothetical protein